jgi:CheY-like chemotaxis protein
MTAALLLRELGHEVLEAQSGAQALALLRGGTTVDLVITDQIMPGMTGTQLAAEILAAWPDLPVVVSSGYGARAEDGTRQLPRLDKPYGQDELADLIARLVGAPDPPA